MEYDRVVLASDHAETTLAAYYTLDQVSRLAAAAQASRATLPALYEVEVAATKTTPKRQAQVVLQ